MSDNDRDASEYAEQLRRRAEDLLKEREQAGMDAGMGEDEQQLIHELLTRRVELDLQIGELLHTQERYRGLVENSYDWFWEVDEDCVYTYASPRIRDLLGYDPDEVVGKTPFDFMPEAEAKSIREAFCAIASEHKPITLFENTLVHKDGHLVVVETSGLPIIDSNGNLRGYRGTDRDISERRRTQKVLRTSQSMLSLIYNSVPQSIFWKDTNSVYVGCNEVFARAVGISSPEDIVGKTDHDLSWPREEAEAYIADDREVMDNDRPKRHIVEPLQQADGSRLWIDTTKIPLHDEQGNVVGILGVYDDITERKRTEDALWESMQMVKLVIEHIPIHVFWKDTSSVYMGCNSAFAYDAGLSAPEEIVGKTDFDLPWEREEAEKYRADDRAVIETGIPRLNYEETQRTAEGRATWLRTNKVPLRDAAGRVIGVLGTYEDITERKQTELTLRLEESRLEALLELSQMTRATVKDLAEFAMEEAVRLTESTVGYVAFVNEDETTLTMHAWSRQAMEECEAQLKPLVYPLETTGLWGEAVRQRRPIITNDYAAPSPWKKGYPEGHVHITRHMNVPVFDGDHIVVVAGVGNKEGDYDESDVRQLTLLMDGMWRIIQRNQAQEQIGKINRTLRMVSGANEVVVRAEDELGLLRDICKVIVEVGGYRMAWIGFVEDDAQKTIRPMAHAGYENGYLSAIEFSWADSKWGRGPTGFAVRTGEPAFIVDIFEDTSFAPWREEAAKRGYGSVVAVPLIAHGKSMGVVCLYRGKPDKFEAEELDLLTRMMSDVSYGIVALRTREERRQADEKLLRRSRQLEMLSNASQQLNAVLEIPVVMRTLVASALELVNAESGAAGMFVDNQMVFTEYNKKGQLMPIDLKFDVGQGVPGWVAQTMKSFISNDSERDPHVIQEIRQDLGFYNMADAPIISKDGRLLGIFEIHNTIGHRPFDESDITMLEGLAASAAVAIENAQLIAERRKAADERLARERQLEEQKREFYRETIKSVTQGKLELVSRDEVKEYLDSAEITASVKSRADTATARHKIVDFCAAKGLGRDRLEMFEVAVGEAITNAIKHADEGEVYAGVRGSSVWVAVSDSGPGISTLTLPGATLRRGFSTKASLGMGYSIMLEASDYIMLCTGPEGTTVVLSANTSTSGQAVSLDEIPDTWSASPGI